jgi:hypothetical protein
MNAVNRPTGKVVISLREMTVSMSKRRLAIRAALDTMAALLSN